MAAPTSKPFRDEPTLHRLVGVYVVIWFATAVSAWDRQAWILENLAVLVFAILVVGGFRRWRFSNASYVAIFAFLVLHTLGAWSTYENFPPGRWVQTWLGLPRNPYDRFVHFAFGFLMAEPCRELLLHYVKTSDRWARRLTVPFILSVSTIYELLESWTARWLRPDLGATFLAIQGDVWDPQKDITAATLGAIVWFGARQLAPRRISHS